MSSNIVPLTYLPRLPKYLAPRIRNSWHGKVSALTTLCDGIYRPPGIPSQRSFDNLFDASPKYPSVEQLNGDALTPMWCHGNGAGRLIERSKLRLWKNTVQWYLAKWNTIWNVKIMLIKISYYQNTRCYVICIQTGLNRSINNEEHLMLEA